MRQGLGVVMLMLASAPGAQQVQMGAPVAAKGHVSALTDSSVVDAGKAQVVELRFKVDDGFHVNSHTPKEEFLIPTLLKLDAGAVQVSGVEYPKGSALKLTGGEVLDVYQGEFVVLVKAVVPKGVTDMSGVLKYQACDAAACFPPKSLVVKVAVTGR